MMIKNDKSVVLTILIVPMLMEDGPRQVEIIIFKKISFEQNKIQSDTEKILLCSFSLSDSSEQYINQNQNKKSRRGRADEEGPGDS